MLGEKGYLRAEFPFCLPPLYTLCARHFFEFSPRILYFLSHFRKHACETRVEMFHQKGEKSAYRGGVGAEVRTSARPSVGRDEKLGGRLPWGRVL